MTVLDQHPNGAIAAVLPDGRRRHFQHGPIDLVIETFGDEAEVSRAYDLAWQAFPEVLPGLVAELDVLRSPAGHNAGSGPVAWRMMNTVQRHAGVFVTPMAAVAGAVADEILTAMTAGAILEKAYVNNGGDIALWLAEGAHLTTGVVTNHDHPALDAFTEISWRSPVRGIATSGWKGRSHSLGIADSVTVLARDAASADVAATLIGNAVTADHPAIERAPAADLAPDSDLGDRLVTTAVGPLPSEVVQDALGRGQRAAEAMLAAGLIEGALMVLQDENWVTGEVGAAPLLAAE